MEWRELCDRKDLQDLPFKIELDEYGRIIMSPFKVYHSLLQGEICNLLGEQGKDGRILIGCAIQTPKGTKVADVAWISQKVYEQIKDEYDSSIAPEVCVEVVSTSNT